MSAPQPGPALMQVDPVHVEEKGRVLLYFGGCDYFRLSWHRAVRAVVKQALGRRSLTVAASRTTTGNDPLYGSMEDRLARFFATESATLAASGYVAVLAVGQALRDVFTHVLIDEKAHGCLKEALRSWKARIRVFRHADPDHVEKLVRRWPARARGILITDGMFAQDGSMPPLREYRDALPARAWIWVDDAHGAGLMGKRGRGALEWAGVSGRRWIQTLSLGKAFGVYGGAILGARSLRTKLLERAEILAGNTPLPLPYVEGLMESIRQLEAHPEWRDRLLEESTGLKRALAPLGWPSLLTPGPIVSWTPPGDPKPMMTALRRAGIHPCFIRYQGRPGCFRFALSSGHTRRQLLHLGEALMKGAG